MLRFVCVLYVTLAAIKDRTQLYLYIASGTSWPILGWNLHENFLNKCKLQAVTSKAGNRNCDRQSNALPVCWLLRGIENVISRYTDWYVANRTYFRGMLIAMWPTEHTFAVCWLLCGQQNILSRYDDCYVANRTYFRGMLIDMWSTEHTFAVCWLLCDQQNILSRLLIAMWPKKHTFAVCSLLCDQKNILSRYADCYVTKITYFRGMLIDMWPTEHTFAVCYTNRQTNQFSQPPSAPHHHGSRLSHYQMPFIPAAIQNWPNAAHKLIVYSGYIQGVLNVASM